MDRSRHDKHSHCIQVHRFSLVALLIAMDIRSIAMMTNVMYREANVDISNGDSIDC